MSFFNNIFSSFSSTKSSEYFQSLDLDGLIYYIQPLWNKYNMGHGQEKMTKTELENLNLAITEYKRRGLDTDYFVSGAGSPGNCVIA